jgi:hypothetical protein
MKRALLKAHDLSWQYSLVIFGDFYVMLPGENHFINKRLQKPGRLNLKWMIAVNNSI